MSYNTKINLNDDRVYQSSGTTLTLSGNTVISTVGNMKYEAHPTFDNNTDIVDKQYVDESIIAGVTGGTVYNLGSPTTTTVGGIIAGTDITGESSNEILEKILTPYQYPAFTSFNITSAGFESIVEVGTTLTGTKTFTSAFSNDDNVEAGSLCIIDITNSNATICSNASVSVPVNVSIGTHALLSCGAKLEWKGCAQNTCGDNISSSIERVTAIYPYYWGKVNAPGANGAGRVELTPSDIINGTPVLSTSAGNITINFNSTADDYLWFAVPATVSDKTAYYVDTIANGDIGGDVGPALNLFPSPELVTEVNNGFWGASTNYEVYLSNKQTDVIKPMIIS